MQRVFEGGVCRREGTDHSRDETRYESDKAESFWCSVFRALNVLSTEQYSECESGVEVEKVK